MLHQILARGIVFWHQDRNTRGLIIVCVDRAITPFRPTLYHTTVSNVHRGLKGVITYRPYVHVKNDTFSYGITPTLYVDDLCYHVIRTLRSRSPCVI
jgi:hypothetical protein